MTAAGTSIIIATRNRETILWTTVQKAVSAIEGKNAEIIIVNDGDQTLVPDAMLAAKIKCFNNPSRGVSFARNFGAANATGDVLFFVDDDMWIIPEVIDWISQHMLQEKNRQCVYNINWEYPPELYKKLLNLKVGRFLLSSDYNTMWGRMHVKGERPLKGLYKFSSIASCSLVMHKDIFHRLNGYNEQLIFQGEDIDLSNRIGLLSIPIYAVFDITLFHNHQDRVTIEGFLNRLSNGYQAEFKAAKAGYISPLSSREYTGAVKVIFELFRITEKGWIFIYKLFPNHPFFKLVVNRLIGLLSGLTRYKEWRNVFIKSIK